MCDVLPFKEKTTGWISIILYEDIDGTCTWHMLM